MIQQFSDFPKNAHSAWPLERTANNNKTTSIAKLRPVLQVAQIF